MDCDGKKLKNLTNTAPIQPSEGGWDWIVFTSRRDGNGEIYVMKDNGEQSFNMTRNFWEDQFATWY
jgi:Tol biopolymer transport system component